MLRLALTAISLICVGVSVAHADKAPAQILNKSIVFSWTQETNLRDTTSGVTARRRVSLKATIYVSSQGRIFERLERSGDGGENTLNNDPSAKNNAIFGEGTKRQFEGNDLVLLRSLPSGAARTVVSFDQSFSSCSVKFQMGRENNRPIVRKGIDGKTYQIMPGTSVIGLTCSVRDGNAFAG